MSPSANTPESAPEPPWFEGISEAIPALPPAAHLIAGGALLVGLTLWLFGRRTTRPAFFLSGMLAGGGFGLVLPPALGIATLFGQPSPHVGLAIGALGGLIGALALYRLVMVIGASAVLAIFGLVGGACYVQMAPAELTPTLEPGSPGATTGQRLSSADEPSAGGVRDEAGPEEAVRARAQTGRAERGSEPSDSGSDSTVSGSSAASGDGHADPWRDSFIGPRRPNMVLASARQPGEFEWPTPDWTDGAGDTRDLSEPLKEEARQSLEREVFGPPTRLARDLPGRLREEASAQLDEQTRQTLRSAADRVLVFLESLQDQLGSIMASMSENQQLIVGATTLGGALLGMLVGATMPGRSAALVTALGGAAVWLAAGVWLAHAIELPGRTLLHRSPLAWTGIWLVVAVVGAVYQFARAKAPAAPAE